MKDCEVCFLLKVKHNPAKHLTNTSGWEMAEAMHEIVLQSTRDAITDCNFISCSADEVTTINNQQWISMHIYVMQQWQRMPILLILERIEVGATSTNIIQIILQSLLTLGGLTEEGIGRKLVCFGCDGDSVFQGHRTGVTTQFREKVAPFMVGVHCMAHQTNLAVQVLSKLPLVSGLENLL